MKMIIILFSANLLITLNLYGQLDLSESELEDIAKTQANVALNFLQKNIIFIANKDNPYLRRTLRIEDISKRFLPNSVIQVASKKNPDFRTNLSPQKYFTRVRDYNYDDVEINFTFQNITDKKQINDLTWEFEFTVGQNFKAYRNDDLAYTDFTIKSVKIIIQNVNGRWNYRFSNIMVEFIS